MAFKIWITIEYVSENGNGDQGAHEATLYITEFEDRKKAADFSILLQRCATELKRTWES